MVETKMWPFLSIADSDAEHDREDDDDDDGGVVGALGDMIISGAPVITADQHDAQKRKRTMSNTLSPRRVILMFLLSRTRSSDH